MQWNEHIKTLQQSASSLVEGVLVESQRDPVFPLLHVETGGGEDSSRPPQSLLQQPLHQQKLYSHHA